MIRTLAVFIALTMSLSAAVTIQKASYAGWSNCYRITNGDVELIVTTDVGPRVLRYGFVNGQNVFKEFKEQLGKSGETTWQARGGHRIWIAPEHVRDTYALDNRPVKATIKGAVIELTQPVEQETGLEKTIIVRLAEKGSGVEVVHHIKNTGAKERRFAPWALTMMAQGGVGITGFPPRGTHPEVLAPTNPLVMWAFSDLSDKRWIFTKKYMVLLQDPKNTSQPQKLGLFNKDTFGAYLLGSDLFMKRYAADPSKTYPDFGCSFETFTSADFLELETLGPLETVRPGATLAHTEHWSLYKNVKIPSWTDAELDRVLTALPVELR
jgi:hypothetical protein